jgi:hypothetical protein
MSIPPFGPLVVIIFVPKLSPDRCSSHEGVSLACCGLVWQGTFDSESQVVLNITFGLHSSGISKIKTQCPARTQLPSRMRMIGRVLRGGAKAVAACVGAGGSYTVYCYQTDEGSRRAITVLHLSRGCTFLSIMMAITCLHIF